MAIELVLPFAGIIHLVEQDFHEQFKDGPYQDVKFFLGLPGYDIERARRILGACGEDGRYDLESEKRNYNTGRGRVENVIFSSGSLDLLNFNGVLLNEKQALERWFGSPEVHSMSFQRYWPNREKLLREGLGIRLDID